MAAEKPIKVASGELENFATGDFVAIAHGGTGATTDSGARTALGLAIGSNVQAFDADLDALAALSSTGFAVRTGANTWAQRSFSQPAAGISISNSDGVSGNVSFALANDLSALEGLASTGIAVRTGSDAWAQRAIAGTSTRIEVSNGDGVSGNPTIDLSTVADGGTGSFLKITRDSYGRVSGTTAVVSGDISALVDTRYLQLSGGTLTSYLTLHADPSSDLHAATKQYVDGIAAGMTWKASVRAATTADIADLAAGAPDTIDGVSLAANDRILVKNQSTGSQNGIYIVQTLGTGANGAWVRASDANSNTEVKGGMTAWVQEGTTNADTAWTLITDGAVTLGTTALTFTQTSGLGQITAGAGLTKTGNTIDIATAASTRITINADSIDLGQPTIGGNGATSGVTKVTVDVYGRVTNTGTATASDVGAQPADADLDGVAGLSTTGLVTRTGAGTYTTRSITQPAAGVTVSNGDGVAGNPTLALANDLLGLEGLSSTGFAVRSASDTWTNRSIATASSLRITVADGDGVAGNPTLDLASGVIGTPGTYNSVTVDTYGRVTSGSNISTDTDALTLDLTNNQGSTINIGQAIYVSAAGEVQLARADASGTKEYLGMVVATTINNTVAGKVAVEGVVTATTGQWDAITGQSGGLTAGATYYLSTSTAGAFTTTVPSTGWIVPVGKALSTTKMEITKVRSVKN